MLSSQHIALCNLGSPGDTWPSSVLTSQIRKRRNGTYFQIRETYLAKNCFSTNLAPYASRLASSTVFGTQTFGYVFNVEVENGVTSTEGRAQNKNQPGRSKSVIIQDSIYGGREGSQGTLSKQS